MSALDLTPTILAPGRETWGIAAVKSGAWALLWQPHKVKELHRMNGTFPLASSEEEALERVRLRIETDPDFAKRWKGWSFCFVKLDKIVECREAA